MGAGMGRSLAGPTIFGRSMQMPWRIGPISQRLLPGLAISLLGVLMLYFGSDYDVGTIRRIGPGFFPAAIAWLLIIAGILVLAEDLARPEINEPLRLRSVLVVSAAILVWALTIERFGFAAATFLLVFVSSLAEKRPRLLHSLFVSVALTAAGYLVFVSVFGLPFDLIRL